MELLCVLVVFAILGFAIYGVVCLFGGRSAFGGPITKRCVRCNGRYQGNLCRTCNAYWPDLPVHSSPGLHEIAGHTQRLFDRGEINPQAFQQIMSCLFQTSHVNFGPSEASVRTEMPVQREQTPSFAKAREQSLLVEPEEAIQFVDGNKPAVLPVRQPATAPTESDLAARRERALRSMVERHQQEEVLEPVPTAAVAAEPPPPARPWSEVLATFMEEGNIRWGELIGGLLIVGCSLALVITFWADIAANQLLRFLTFNGVTTALFGVGLYTAKKWKLKATSEGVLTIASLLVPLNFVAMAAVQRGTLWEIRVIGGEIVSIALLGTLTYLATEFIARHARWSMTLGVLIPSILTLVARRADAEGGTVTVDLITAAAMTVAGLAALFPQFDLRAPSEERATIGETLRRLGVPLFAAALVAGFIAWRADGAGAAAHRLSPLVALAALPIGIVGMRIAAANKPTDGGAASDTGARDYILGLSLAIGGAVLLGAGIVLAWPSPVRLLVAMTLGLAAFGTVAWRRNVPAATLGAIILLAGMWALGWHLIAGNIPWSENAGGPIFDAAIRNDFGFSWVPLVGALVAGSLFMRSEKWAEHGMMMRFGVIGLGGLSLAQIAVHTVGQPGNLMFAAYAGMAYAGLAAILAWQARNRWWFHTFQALSTVAISVGSVGLIEESSWFKALEHPWRDPGTWTVLAASWAGLALAWSGAEWWSSRLVSQSPEGESFAEKRPFAYWVLDTEPPLGGLLLAAVLLIIVPLSIFTVAPALLAEWSPATSSSATEVSQFGSVVHRHVRTPAVWLALAFSLVTIVFRAMAASGEGARWSETHWRTLRVVMASVTFAAVALVFASSFEHLRITGAILGWIAAAAIMIATAVESWRTWSSKSTDASSRAVRPHSLTLGLAAGGIMPWFLSGSIALVAAMGRSQWWELFGSDLSIPWFIVAGSMALAVATMIALRTSRFFFGETFDALTRAGQLFVIVVTGSAVIALAIDGMHITPLAGPLAASSLATVSPLVVYGGPIFAVAMSAATLAAVSRNSIAGVCTSVMAHLAFSVVYFGLRPFAPAQSPLPVVGDWLFLQIIVATLIALIWMGVRWLRDQKVEFDTALGGQVLLSQLFAVRAILPAWYAIVIAPDVAAILAPLMAKQLAAVALLSAAAMIVIAYRQGLVPGTKRSLFVFVMVVAVLGGCLFEHFTGRTGSAFHVLLIVQCSIAVAIFIGGLVLDWGLLPIPEAWLHSWAPRWSQLADAGASDPMAYWGWRRWLSNVVAMAALVALVPTVRAFWVGFDGHYWLAGGCLALGVLAYLVGGWARARGMHYAMAALVLGGLCPFVYVEMRALFSEVDAWLMSIVASGAVAMFVALGSRFAFGQMRANDEKALIVSAARPLVWYALAMFVIATALVVFDWYFFDHYYLIKNWGIWARISITGALAGTVALLWDNEARESLPLIYVGGLLLAVWGVVESLTVFPPSLDIQRWMPLFMTAAIGAYSVLVSYLSSRRHGLREIADAIGIPESRGGVEGHFHWLSNTQVFMSAVISIAALVMSLVYGDWHLRGVAAKPILGQAIALAVLARGERRSWLQSGSLILVTLYFVALSWTPLAPLPGGFWVDHVVAAGGVMAIAAAVCGLGLIKFLPSGNQWLDAAQRLIPWYGALATAAIVVVWVYETATFAGGHDPQVGPLSIAVVAATLGGVILASLAAALLPGRDPFALSERGKQAYIYGAEIAAVLLVVHLRITMPQIFAGIWEQYWPIICVGIGFAGAGLSEWFERSGRKVLSDPLRNTGIFAPILPAIGYYLAPTGLDYSLVLLSTSLVYGGLAMGRRSFALALLSALALNGSFWSILHRTDHLQFQQHPQLWLIPPALCVLAAAQWSRDKLTHQQLTAIRYASALVLYASSTADIILHGMGGDIRFPILLGALAIAGAMVGIWLRVRSFLYLGTAFLAVAIVAVIKHAAVDREQTWILWVVGIITGVAIIAVFGLFEKKRDEILLTIDRLKAWEA
jgi:hypothetical protein